MAYSERRTQHGGPCVRTFVFSALGLLATALCFAAPGYAQHRDLVTAPVESANRVFLTGHHPAWASAQNDRGAVPADLPLDHLEFVLARSPEQQQAFDQLLREQQDPASPNYHHWLTPVEIGERFGASQHDLDAIANWLQSQNLHLDSVANSRVRIQFSGTASAVGDALREQMHYYSANGEQRLSIAGEPQIPVALAGIIKSISGLYTVKLRPVYGLATVQVPAGNLAGGLQGGAAPDFTNGALHSIFPGDFAAIYNLPAGNITGAGQTIAVVGRSRVYDQDITTFQTLSGLSPQAPTVIIPSNGKDPGPAQTSSVGGNYSADQAEATLDVTRTSSIAPGSTIDLVVSANTLVMDGVQIASEYVVDTSPVFAHIMGISFSECEGEATSTGVSSLDTLFQMAAAEGISVFVASGDSGAAGCDNAFGAPPASQTLGVNAICSSSYVTCVGGTEFADSSNPTQYWATTNSATYESALGYIPEGGWNEPGTSNQPVVAASGGGVSLYIQTPPWQTGTGVPGAQGRYTPDVAFSAAAHDGYIACFAAAGYPCTTQNGVLNPTTAVRFSGTSASAQDMSGITALLNQSEGAAQGELNQNLYRLAATPSNEIFHDITVASSGVSGCVVTTPSLCNNSTPSPTSQTGGLSGYLVGTGYDEVTGLGSINVGNLLANWGTASTTTLSSSLNPSIGGQSVTFTARVIAGGGTPTGSVTFFDGMTSLETDPLNAGVATFTTSSLAVGSHSITANYNGNFPASTSSALIQTTNVAGFAPVAAQTVTAGQNDPINLTAYEASGYNMAFGLTCVGLPSKATCMFSQNSVTPGPPPGGTTIQLTLETASSKFPSGPLDQSPWPWSTLGVLTAIAALLLSGTILLQCPPRRRLACGLCIAMIALAGTMIGCGGGASYTGTPKGTTTFTVMGTSGSTTISTQVTVTVQ